MTNTEWQEEKPLAIVHGETEDRIAITVELTESQRQAVVLALAHLSLDRPGWDTVLRTIAGKLDNPDLAMYESFKVTGASEPHRVAHQA